MKNINSIVLEKLKSLYCILDTTGYHENIMLRHRREINRENAVWIAKFYTQKDYENIIR
jgi:hypothetical protein